MLPDIAGYTLSEEIGRGGMGVVYKALQLSTRRVVALKVMLVGPFAARSARLRFDREVELAILKEGDLFGEISILRDTPTTAHVRGMQRGEVLFLHKEDFLGMAARHPEVQQALSEITEERLRHNELLLEEVEDGEDMVLLV